MVHIQRAPGGAALHLIRYDFDAALDRTPPLPELTVEVELPRPFGALSLHSPDGTLTGTLEVEGGRHRIALRDVPLYGIALLSE
jgi:hypothetical protein